MLYVLKIVKQSDALLVLENYNTGLFTMRFFVVFWDYNSAIDKLLDEYMFESEEL